MARTYRKRPETFERYARRSRWIDSASEEEIDRRRAKYYTRTDKFFYFNLPKAFRRMVNRQRRAYDRRELHRELTHYEYEGLYDRWNGKTGNAWGYW